MKYFEIIELEKKYIALLKYPISLDENVEVKKELIKILKKNNVILDLLMKNGNASNRFFNAYLTKNDIELKLYKDVTAYLVEKVNDYLRKHVYLLLESVLSSYEINKIVSQY